MERKEPGIICCGKGLLNGLLFRFVVRSFLFAVPLLAVSPPLYSQSATELGSEGDLVVLGTGGTALDPNVKIKGFTVFGSTQAVYTGAVTGNGNVVVNGVLAVSSGAYFVGNSTFTGANKIFVNDGSPGQILGKNTGGWLEWFDAGSIGDNLGNHVATTTLQMGAYGVNTSSAVTAARYQINGSTVLAILPSGSLGLGPEAGRLTTGSNNHFLGGYSGYNNTSGVENTAIGNRAGYNNTTASYNSFAGSYAGYSNTVGANNSFTGYASAYSNTTGADNSVIGVNAARNNQTGSANAILGNQAGYGSSGSFSSSTLVGYKAGFALTTGSDNILLGWQAGDALTTGGRNILLGYDIDAPAETSANFLSIGNLIFATGGFGTGTAAGAGSVGIGTAAPDAKLVVAGQVKITGGSPGAGKVLTSDAAGLATWGTASGDNLGNHVATTTLQMGAYGVNTTSAITAGYYQINGSTVLAILPSGSLGLGPEAGRLTTGSDNHFLGGYSGYNNTSGVNNTAIGNRAGYNNTTASYNSFAGSYAGYYNSVGANNSFIGYASAYSNSTGANNSVIGVNAARNNQTGSANAILGNQAGYGSSGSFSSSTLVGYKAGFALTTGSDNILLGWQAGDALTTGGRNIIIGYDIDAPAAAGSNQLSIGNLIFATGVDGTGTAISNGSVGIGVVNPGAKLEVAGQVKITGGSPGAGKVLTSDAAGLATWGTAAGDNLGNHVATTTLNLNGQSIVSAASGTFTQGITASSVTLLNVAGAGLSVSSSAYLAVSGGFVGIGTTAPGYPLVVQTNGTGTTHVSNIVSRLQANAAGRDVTLQFSDNATYSNFISMMNGNFLFTTSNPGAVDAMYIKSDGNVGIGTTAPGAKLEVKQSALDSYAVKVSSNDGTGMAVVNNQGNVGIGTTGPNQKLDVFGAISSGVNDYTYNAAVYQLTNQSRVDGISGTSPTGAFRWYTNPNNSDRSGFLYQLRSYDTTNGESAGLVTFKGDGNVGIGTTNPLTILNVKQTSANVPGIRISRTQADGNPQLQFSDDVTYANTIEMRAGTGDILIAKAAGNVGIGTTVPASKLVVDAQGGNTGWTDTALAVIGADTSSTKYILKAVNPNGGGNGLIVRNDGNVGIGTTSPSEKLSVNGAARLDGLLKFYNESGGAGAGVVGNLGVYGGDSATLSVNRGLSATRNFRIHDGSAASADGSSGLLLSAEGSSGRVGIGTISPTAKLHIGGTPGVDGIRFPDGTLMISAGVGSASNLANAADAVVNGDSDANGSGAVRLQTGAADRLYIANGGNVGIGTTSPGTLVHVEKSQDSYLPLLLLRNPSTTGSSGVSRLAIAADDYGQISFFDDLATDFTAGPPASISYDVVSDDLILNNNGTLVLDTTGNVGIGTAMPVNKFEIRGTAATPATSGSAANGVIRAAASGFGRVLDIGVSNGASLYSWIQSRDDASYASNYDLALQPNGGNVGIGTPGPTHKLRVEGGILATSSITAQGGFYGDGTTLTGVVTNPMTSKLNINASPSLGTQNQAGIAIDTHVFVTAGNVGIGTTTPQGLLHVGAGATPGLLVNSSGNVGIGTAGPGTILDVRGANKTNANEHGTISLYSTDSFAIDKGGSIGFFGKYNTAGGYANFARIYGAKENSTDGLFQGYIAFALSPNGTPLERMRITSTGNVGISTGAPQARLDVLAAGSAPTDMVQIWRRGDGVVVGSMSATGYLQAVKFIGDGSGLTGMAGDNLGSHIATTDLNMSGQAVFNASSMTITGAGVSGAGPVFTVAGSTLNVLANGNVGIGTTTPQGLLHVGAGATPGLLVTSVGNVGIGTTAPAQALHVYKSIADTVDYAAIQGTTRRSAVDYSYLLAPYAPDYSDVTEYQNKTVLQTYGSHIALSAYGTSDNIYFYAGNRTGARMIINNSGNVGIGTTAPAGKLDILSNGSATRSDISVTAANGAHMVSGAYTANNYYPVIGVRMSDNNPTIVNAGMYAQFTDSGSNLILGGSNNYGTGIASSVFIQYNGNVGISTGAPQGRLDVLGAGSAPTDMVQIWRRVDGVVVGSMSATGYLQAVKFIGDGSGLTGMAGDNLGSHIATTDLNMSGQAVFNASSMTITGAGVSGAGPVFTVAGSTLNVLANGNVGIGTTGPSAKLEVTDGDIRSGIEITAGYPFLKLMNINANANARNWALSHSIIEQGDFAILQSAAKDGDPVTAATSRLYFGGSGNVGIGTTGPDAPLAFGNGFTTKIKFYDSGSDEYGIGLDGSGHLNLFGGNSADTNIRTGGESGTALMTLKASGNVGIGTAGPGAKLHVSGGDVNTASFKVEGSSYVILNAGNVGIGTTGPGQKLVVAESGAGSVFTSWQNSDTGYANTDGFSIGLDSSEDANVWNRENTNMVFATNNAERMRLTSAGNVGVGTTGPGAKLEVKQSASDSYAVKVSSNDGTGMVVVNNQGNVGIGTAGPNQKLDVFGAMSSGVNDYTYNAAVYQLTNQSRVDGISGTSPTGAFRWYTNPNNSDRSGFLYQLRSYDTTNGESAGLVTFKGDGNVGIGTTGPASKLVVDAQGGNTGWTDTALAVIGADTSSTKYILKAVNTNGGGNGLIVRNDGNVGIGTTAPNSRLDLGSTYGASGEKFLFYNDNPSGPLAGTKMGFYLDRFGQNNATLVFAEHSAEPGSFVIAAKSTDGTTINPYVTVKGLTGNVGIGTTSPGYGLEVINSAGVHLSTTATAGYGLYLNSAGNVTIARYTVLAADTGITLTSADFGKTITVNSASAQTVSLPSVTGADIGATVTVVKLGAGTVTIQAAASTFIADSGSGQTIYNNSPAETYSTITLRLTTSTMWSILGGNGSWTTTN